MRPAVHNFFAVAAPATRHRIASPFALAHAMRACVGSRRKLSCETRRKHDFIGISRVSRNRSPGIFDTRESLRIAVRLGKSRLSKTAASGGAYTQN
jgi:hypothetical protein